MKAPENGFSEDTGEGEQRTINSELWHACAGPLVSLPPVGSLVVYFPQGHSEQVAATMQKETDTIPNYPSLPSKLICMLHSVTLHADAETDEVYAQMTLQPVNKYDKEALLASNLGLKQNKQPTEFFCKTLTASDTSTHGGFSVPRRAAEKIFPPLDFSMQPPAQELVVKDLHDVTWTFRHVYRGQPKRHLLTTGWSVFVSTKRLVAGDSVLFIRDEKSQLLLGIRRANKQQPALSSSVLSSESMHIGVLAAAAHAAANNSPFTIFYNPRASPSEFVVPLAKYNKAMYAQVSLGMRFRMMFETEESGVRRYMGTITGISDLDPIQWKNSQWRNLQVGWDESTAGERQKRVSIWEIEPVATPFYICPPPFFRPKLTKPGLPGDESDAENTFNREMPWLSDDVGLKDAQGSIFPGFNLVQWMNMQRNPQAVASATPSPYFPSVMVSSPYNNIGSDDPSRMLNFQAQALPASSLPLNIPKTNQIQQLDGIQQTPLTWTQQQQQVLQQQQQQQVSVHPPQQQIQQSSNLPQPQMHQPISQQVLQQSQQQTTLLQLPQQRPIQQQQQQQQQTMLQQLHQQSQQLPQQQSILQQQQQQRPQQQQLQHQQETSVNQQQVAMLAQLHQKKHQPSLQPQQIHQQQQQSQQQAPSIQQHMQQTDQHTHKQSSQQQKIRFGGIITGVVDQQHKHQSFVRQQSPQHQLSGSQFVQSSQAQMQQGLLVPNSGVQVAQSSSHGIQNFVPQGLPFHQQMDIQQGLSVKNQPQQQVTPHQSQLQLQLLHKLQQQQMLSQISPFLQSQQSQQQPPMMQNSQLLQKQQPSGVPVSLPSKEQYLNANQTEWQVNQQIPVRDQSSLGNNNVPSCSASPFNNQESTLSLLNGKQHGSATFLGERVVHTMNKFVQELQCKDTQVKRELHCTKVSDNLAYRNATADQLEASSSATSFCLDRNGEENYSLPLGLEGELQPHHSSHLPFGSNVDGLMPDTLLSRGFDSGKDLQNLLSGYGNHKDIDTEISTAAISSHSFGVPDMPFKAGCSNAAINENGVMNRGSWGNQPQGPQRVRTYTKVQKRGSVGRSIDVTRYRGYNELRRDLASMFGIDGQLEDPHNSDWKLVYVDHENDILLVGDDPWDEFVGCVQSIKILSAAEVQQMSLDGDLAGLPAQNQACSGSDNMWRGNYDTNSAASFDR